MSCDAFEELQVAEEELQVQTEELSTNRALLGAERRRYRALFEHAPVAYVITDDAGTVTDANRAANALLARDHGSVVGTALVSLVPATRRRAFRAQLAAFGTSDIETDVRLRLRRHDGRALSVSAPVGVV